MLWYLRVIDNDSNTAARMVYLTREAAAAKALALWRQLNNTRPLQEPANSGDTSTFLHMPKPAGGRYAVEVVAVQEGEHLYA